MHRITTIAMASFLVWAVTLRVQAQPATTVQLPTYSFFTVQTSVQVPDGGGAYLGGISRAQSGSRYRGTPFLNRGIGSSVQTGGMSVRATIIYNHEIDQMVLSEGMAARGYGPRMTLEQIAAAQEQARKQPVPTSDTQGVTSLAAIRQSQQAQDSAKQAEARQLFTKAEVHLAKDQIGLAKIFFRMAASRATGDLQTEALGKIATLERGSTGSSVAAKEY